MTVTPEIIARLNALGLTPDQFAVVISVLTEVGASRRKAAPPPPDREEEDLFQRFYRAYPKHEAVAKARQAWTRARATVDAQTLIDAAKAFATQRLDEDPRFTPLPASWLNAERWKDETTKEFGHATRQRSFTRLTVSEQAHALIDAKYDAAERGTKGQS